MLKGIPILIEDKVSRNDQILAVAVLALVAAVALVANAPIHISDFGAIVEVIAALVTAVATAVLARFTFVLARETKRLADVGEQPNVVVTFEPNRHAMTFLDVHVENAGTATAYNITLDLRPPLQIASRSAVGLNFPFRNISLLKPGQMISSSFARWQELQTKQFTVLASWQRNPRYAKREYLAYDIDLNFMEGISRLGGDPQVEMADAAKAIADKLGNVASGRSKLEVNLHTRVDRERERREREESVERQRTKANPSSGGKS